MGPDLRLPTGNPKHFGQQFTLCRLDDPKYNRASVVNTRRQWVRLGRDLWEGTKNFRVIELKCGVISNVVTI
jgi:hypothetical protein